MSWEIRQGDALDLLKAMSAESVQTCITSPPYFGLRDYGHDSQIGLEPTPGEYVAALVAVFAEVRRVLRDDGTLWLNLGSSYFGAPTTGGCSAKSTPTGGGGKYRSGSKNEKMFNAASGGSDPSQSRQPQRVPAYGTDGTEPQDSQVPGSACPDLCDGCRAATQSHHARSGCTDRGSEHLGSVREPHGALPHGAQASTTPRSSEPPRAECSHCANCGACLAVLRSSSRDVRLCARTVASRNGTSSLASDDHSQGTDASGMAWVNYTSKLKPKDMVPIPWMVAMALQADGWYLRSEIVWAKPNPMPESVTDRPTKAHEQVFLLSKSPRYFYDADAIREPHTRDWWDDGSTNHYRDGRAQTQEVYRQMAPGDASKVGRKAFSGTEMNKAGANKRSVWIVSTKPYSEAHFATFPPQLVGPMVLAGSSEQACGVCGAPWGRVVERTSMEVRPGPTTDQRQAAAIGVGSRSRSGTMVEAPTSRTIGWEPTCDHSDGSGTSLVLDPFCGAATTGLVALRRQRSFIGLELNPEYCELGRNRLRDDQPMFNVPGEVAA